MSYPAQYRIGPVRQGSTLKRHFTWRVAGEPVDLTGWSARMDIRESADADTTIIAANTDNYITLGGDDGTILLSIPATVMEGVEQGRYVYDLEMVSPDQEVTAIIAGQFVVTAEVTRND